MSSIDTLDPNAPAVEGALFGLPFTEANAQLLIQPVPFDATTSYRRGTAGAPSRILEASAQVDLFLPEFPRAYEKGMTLLSEPPTLTELNKRHRALVDDFRESGSTTAQQAVNREMSLLNDELYRSAKAAFEAKKIMAFLGGDHSTPFGLMKAVIERFPRVGILHFDAHFDLRKSYEGFEFSHASIFYNVLTKLAPAKLVSVGLRDFCEEEWDFAKAQPNLRFFTSTQIFEERAKGASFATLTDRVLSELPEEVYISLDVDALDPSFCPSTGTPVPGGLTFEEIQYLIRKLVSSKRRLVGFDLNEVGTGEYDAIVGARLLYYLSSACLASFGS